MARKPEHQIVSANKLLEGDVVYFDRTGEWTRNVGRAAVAKGGEAAARLLREAELTPHLVVGPYLVEVEIDADALPSPSQMRDVMRENGPTVARQHA